MKKILILVMSSEKSYYKDLMEAQIQTWDSEKVDGVETVFYCGRESNKLLHNTTEILHGSEIVYLNIKEQLLNVAPKTQMAFEYALHRPDWDYICRPNASTYIDKKILLDYIQDKPTTYFGGLVAPTNTYPPLTHYLWGVQYIISRDLVELSVKKQWDYSKMDDIALALVLQNEVEFSNARMATIHKKENGYEVLTYDEGTGNGYSVKELSELNLPNQYAYRCKQDMDRKLDCQIMKQLYESKHRSTVTPSL